jgi:hypothetical protein
MSRIEAYRFGRVLVDALERIASTLTADKPTTRAARCLSRADRN